VGWCSDRIGAANSSRGVGWDAARAAAALATYGPEHIKGAAELEMRIGFLLSAIGQDNANEEVTQHA
jgi:hypothetical protein